jgi:hypothetical protein
MTKCVVALSKIGLQPDSPLIDQAKHTFRQLLDRSKKILSEREENEINEELSRLDVLPYSGDDIDNWLLIHKPDVLFLFQMNK